MSLANARSPRRQCSQDSNRLHHDGDWKAPPFTIRQGDAIRVPAAATQCEASGEAGIPNLFCTHLGSRSRYQVVFWSDEVQVYDLARHGEPMVPTFVVPSKLRRAGK